MAPNTLWELHFPFDPWPRCRRCKQLHFCKAGCLNRGIRQPHTGNCRPSSEALRRAGLRLCRPGAGGRRCRPGALQARCHCAGLGLPARLGFAALNRRIQRKVLQVLVPDISGQLPKPFCAGGGRQYVVKAHNLIDRARSYLPTPESAYNSLLCHVQVGCPMKGAPWPARATAESRLWTQNPIKNARCGTSYVKILPQSLFVADQEFAPIWLQQAIPSSQCQCNRALTAEPRHSVGLSYH